MQSELAQAKGGVLLVSDAHALVGGAAGGAGDKPRGGDDYYGKLALEKLVASLEEDELSLREQPAPRGDGERASRRRARVVLLLACSADRVGHVLDAAPALASLAPTRLEFAAYSCEEIGALVRQAVAARGFELAPELVAAADDADAAPPAGVVLPAAAALGACLPKLGDDAARDGGADGADRPGGVSAAFLELLRPKIAKAGAERGGTILVRELVDDAVRRQTNRVYSLETVSRGSLLSLTKADFDDDGDAGRDANRDAEGVLRRLDAVIGLRGVKAHVRSLAAQMQLDQKRRLCGLAAHGRAGQSMHMIFSGNPGTGKTTIGRLVAELLTALGKLPKGHLVETDRAGLVAPYCGQTALKVQEIVRSAIGGMLFVDEAYALVKDPKDTFGKEALDTLIKLVEDHRDDLVVVLAGYPAEMEELLSHNPGVRSRFPTVIQFDDYEVTELEQIAGGMLAKASMRLDDGAKAAMRKTFEAIVKAGGKESGNGRAVRNVVEKALRAQAMRLAGLESTMSPAELSLLIERDFA